MSVSAGIRQELALFLQACACGCGLTLLYDVIRLARRLIAHSAFAAGAEDLLYWLTCGALIFYMLYEKNSGAVRAFALAAVVLGMILCLQLEKLLKKRLKNLKNKLIYPFKRFILDKEKCP